MSSTHKSSPRPADIQVTAGNYEAEDLRYNTTWRKLKEVKEVSTKVAEKSFELLIPFLEEWKDMNPGSIVEWHVDDRKHIQHLYVCPEYTDQLVTHDHPLILVDVAHLKSCYKGTILIYSGLTGNHQSNVVSVERGDTIEGHAQIV